MINTPDDTRAAVMEQFERDLGSSADDFVLVNTELSFTDRPEAQDLPDYGQSITSSLLLRLEGRAVTSDIPVGEYGLETEAGDPIESLSITISALPFGVIPVQRDEVRAPVKLIE